jgi:hypothetical protein
VAAVRAKCWMQMHVHENTGCTTQPPATMPSLSPQLEDSLHCRKTGADMGAARVCICCYRKDTKHTWVMTMRFAPVQVMSG